MPSETQALLDRIGQQVLALDYVIEADREAMLSLISELASVRGVSTIDGQSLRAWFFEKRTEHLSKALVEIENVNPETAAFIQSTIDATKLADDS